MLNKIFQKLFPTTPLFVSPIDKFLAKFDQRHPQKSSSQQREIAKYDRISYLRDHVVQPEVEVKIWEKF